MGIWWGLFLYVVKAKWCHGVVVITGQLSSTKFELRFRPCLRHIEDSRLWGSLREVPARNKATCLLLVNDTTKTIHHHRVKMRQKYMIYSKQKDKFLTVKCYRIYKMFEKKKKNWLKWGTGLETELKYFTINFISASISINYRLIWLCDVGQRQIIVETTLRMSSSEFTRSNNVELTFSISKLI